MSQDRDERGRLLPGHHQPGPGRPKRETEQAILQAITEALDPATIKAALIEALQIAREQRSPRAIVAVLELAAGYGVGKPVARIHTQETNPIAEALAAMRAMHFGETVTSAAEVVRLVDVRSNGE